MSHVCCCGGLPLQCSAGAFAAAARVRKRWFKKPWNNLLTSVVCFRGRKSAMTYCRTSRSHRRSAFTALSRSPCRC